MNSAMEKEKQVVDLFLNCSYFKKVQLETAHNSKDQNEFQAMVTDLVQKTFERFLWKDLEVAHVLKVQPEMSRNSQYSQYSHIS